VIQKNTSLQEAYKSIVPSWQFRQVMMKQSDFLESLQYFPKVQIKEKILDLLQPYLEMIDVNDNDMKATSSPAAGLCSWDINMVGYHHVEKFVRPKKQAAEAVLAQLTKTQRELNLLCLNNYQKKKELLVSFQNHMMKQWRHKLH
jgi:hypothetical protein